MLTDSLQPSSVDIDIPAVVVAVTVEVVWGIGMLILADGVDRIEATSISILALQLIILN